MKVHHLNCGSMQFPTSPLVCHVLLLETDNGLVLVDSGFGLGDIAQPAVRIGGFRRVIRPVLDSEETAVRQIERLGFHATDVRHILLTHLDYDHIGGVSDFPNAHVHVTSAEALGAFQGLSVFERRRYERAQWMRESTIVEHQPGTETWQGFSGVTPLDAIADGVLLVPLPGHSRGHAAYAIDAGDRWILHAGDAFYHHTTLDRRSRRSEIPFILRAQESFVVYDRALARRNRERLASLHASAGTDIDIINAHSPVLYERSSERARQAA